MVGRTFALPRYSVVVGVPRVAVSCAWGSLFCALCVLYFKPEAVATVLSPAVATFDDGTQLVAFVMSNSHRLLYIATPYLETLARQFDVCFCVFQHRFIVLKTSQGRHV